MKKPFNLSRISFIFLLAGLALSGAVYCDSNGPFVLSVSVTGIGLGKVVSDVGGINCTKAGGSCNASLDAGTIVNLTAIPDQGFFFNGWQGACHGIGPCMLALNQATPVQASFVNIAFFSNRDLDPTQDAVPSPAVVNIWLVNSDGSHPQALAGITGVKAAGSSLPTFSPDGNQIVFISERNLDGSPTSNPNGSSNVWVMDADGGHPHALAGLDVTGVDSGFSNPRWSPDGSQIVFLSTRDINGSQMAHSQSANIWVVNANDTNLKVLAGLDKADVRNFGPVWSPDGTKIAFGSNRDISLAPTPNPNQNSNIWVINADGNGLTPLTKITANDVTAEQPQWSPDGSQIAFASNRSLDTDPNGPGVLRSNIWKMDADGSHPVHLTADTGTVSNRNPQWSPDGSLIVFQSNQDPNHPDPTGPGVNAGNIWAVAADGSKDPFPLTALTDSSANCTFPYWAPDSSVTIFESNRNLNPSQDNTLPNATHNIWIVNPDGSGDMPVTDLTNMNVFNASAFNTD